MYGNAILGGVMGDYLGATISVAELLVYAVLCAEWSKLDSWEACKPLLVLAGVAALPIMYSRRIACEPLLALARVPALPFILNLPIIQADRRLQGHMLG
eukprot:scaffold279410_cov14-Tisochrysis_lutea.AAC.1